MSFVLVIVVVTKEGVIQPELQDDRRERQRHRQQRQNAKLVCSKVFAVDGHQHEPERAVYHTADAEDQRVFDGLLDLSVNRSLLRVRILVSLER